MTSVITSPTTSDLGGGGGIVLHQRDIGGKAPAAGQLEDPLQQEWGQRLARDALGLRATNGLGDAVLDLGCVERLALGDRIGDQHAAHPHLELQRDRRSDVVGTVEAVVDLVAAGPRPEGGEVLAPVSQHRHAVGLQHFQRLGNVENGFGSRADHRYRRPPQFLEIGRDVERRFGPTMHAADAARPENLDPRQRGDLHRGRHRGSGQPALDQQGRHVAPRGLGGAAAGQRQPLQRFAGNADLQFPVHDGDRRRHGAIRAHHGLDVLRHLQILRIGHAVGDDCRFQRHHRLACGQGVGDHGTE
jgi:hypothetical protein